MVREEYLKVLGIKSMVCGFRSSDISNFVSWFKVFVFEVELILL